MAQPSCGRSTARNCSAGVAKAASTIRENFSLAAREAFRCYRVAVFKFNKRSPLMLCFVTYLCPDLRLPIKGRFVTYITSLIVMISQMSRGQKTFQLNSAKPQKSRALNNNEVRLIDFPLLRRHKTERKSPGPGTGCRCTMARCRVEVAAPLERGLEPRLILCPRTTKASSHNRME